MALFVVVLLDLLKKDENLAVVLSTLPIVRIAAWL